MGHLSGGLADVFHDVDLAAAGPRRGTGAHHPECGPGALTGRQPDAGLDVAVFDLHLALGVDARRGVFAVLHRLLAGLDHQRAGLGRDDGRAQPC